MWTRMYTKWTSRQLQLNKANYDCEPSEPEDEPAREPSEPAANPGEPAI